MNIEDKAYFAVLPVETEKKIRDLTAAWRKLMNVADNLHGMANPSPEIMKRQDQVDADMERIGNQIAELKKSIGVQENVSVRLAKPVEDKRYFGRRTKNTTEIAKQVPVKSESELNALCIAASKKHAGSYIFAYVDFGLANIFKADKLPTNAYASDDWKLGYWKDGVRYAWSEARIAAAQRALDKLSGLQSKPVEDKAYFDNATNVNYDRLHKINRLLREVNQLVIAREDDKAKKLATKIKAMIANNAVMEESKNQLSELNSIMLGKSFARQGSKAKFAQDLLYHKWIPLMLTTLKNFGIESNVVSEKIIVPKADVQKAKEIIKNWVTIKSSSFITKEDISWWQNKVQSEFARTGTKAKFASDTNYAHKNTIKIKGKSDKIYALIDAEEDYGDNLTGFWNGHVQNNSNPKVKDMVVLGKFKSKEAAKAAAIKALKQEEQGTNFSKSKFANRGAFAEASSSPVLGSLLEKKVMPEGGWRAVETDGGALVIALEDGDIAGNFARRASENGYSATAPMAMAGRFWNVKVQNENKQ